MNNSFQGPTASELHAFMQFKRSFGYGYMRAEFTLREFDRFLIEYAARNRGWKLDQAAIAWLSSKPARKPISVSADAAVLRQFYRYLRRSSEPGTIANRSGRTCLPSPLFFRILSRKRTFFIFWSCAPI